MLLKSITFMAIMILHTGCTPTQTPASPDPRCETVPQTGKCRGHFEKYYFDASSATCKTFVWGGCGGVVPFDSLEACEAACISSR
ncbi:MAG: BPTI/Kunitz domain-containing protein [Campylobacterales bacterium]|nr:BPTI/Kunitz domain-containing protein [Campylobacterales bacterium]